MFGNVPEDDGIEGVAGCDQLIDGLGAHVEMKHIARLLRG